MTDEITLDAPETRLERFLAAAAGMDGITLDEPETRIEKYLYKIAQGSGGVPAVEDADKGKYLHANESTGDLEWSAAGGSGSGVLVCHADSETGALNHTWQEIHDSDFAVLKNADGDVQVIEGIYPSDMPNKAQVAFSSVTLQLPTVFECDTASDYPVLVQDSGGNNPK